MVARAVAPDPFAHGRVDRFYVEFRLGSISLSLHVT
jgi:hypothetical protein